MGGEVGRVLIIDSEGLIDFNAGDTFSRDRKPHWADGKPVKFLWRNDDRTGTINSKKLY
jgi:hypothetical protein